MFIIICQSSPFTFAKVTCGTTTILIGEINHTQYSGLYPHFVPLLLKMVDHLEGPSLSWFQVFEVSMVRPIYIILTMHPWSLKLELGPSWSGDVISPNGDVSSRLLLKH
jgi:hypothetical protein